MAGADTTAFLVAFGATWAGIGLYLLHLSRRIAALREAVERIEARRR